MAVSGFGDAGILPCLHVGILGSTGPVATLVLGMLVLKETISLSQVAGMGLVLVGVWFISQKPKGA
ncbi:MAG TPA: EamA family transporter [Burkholderiales bacterium]|jgi:drug/metabolite transporter (DMT)-like permease